MDLRIAHGACYSNGNFYLNIRFSLPESEDLRYYDTWGNLYWCRKDCFTPDYTTIEDTSDWKEWNYTTAAGSEVLIFRSPSDWRGWIVSQREEAQLVLQLEVRKDIYSDQSTESWYLTDRQIELIADAIDFSIQPNRVSQEDVENQLPVPANTWQNGWNVEVKNVKTDGYIVQILLGIAAPEGVDITHVEADDELSHYFSINPGNEVEYFTPENGEKNGYTMSWIPEEDGDGLDNTQNVLMTCNISMRDGSVPFAEGAVWNLHIEDLVHYRWDSQKQDIAYSTLTEGEWCFPIRFGEENGDYRRIELLTQPMILPIITAWEMRGNAVEEIWETTEVSSIQIHPLSVHIRSERANVDYGWLRVVCLDGTQIALSAQMYDANCIYLAEEWIDLEQAAYLLLQDGTMIPIPEGTPMT